MVVVPLIAIPYVPTVESADFGKTEKDRNDSDFSGIHPSLPLRRIYHMNQAPKCMSMDIYGCGYVFWRSHSHLTDLGSHHTTVSRISENEYKKDAARKGWGVPGPYPTSQLCWCECFFAHQRFHGKPGSSGLSESIIDICRKSTMHGIWKNDLMNSEESTKPFFHEHINNRFVCELVPW